MMRYETQLAVLRRDTPKPSRPNASSASVPGAGIAVMLNAKSVFVAFQPLLESFDLPPGNSRLLEVRFAPLSTGEVHGLLHLSIEAPSETTATLSLSGSGL